MPFRGGGVHTIALLWVAISTGRCNTLIKTLEDGVHADELKEWSRFYRGIEGGVEGSLEASRGAKVEWASIWRTLNRLFITSWPRTGGSRPQERGVTHVLHRPVEIAGKSGRLFTPESAEIRVRFRPKPDIENSSRWASLNPVLVIFSWDFRPSSR